MSSNFDERIEELQTELDRRLNEAEGETEEDRTEFRKRAFDELSTQIIEVQCQKRMREAEASSAGGGRIVGSTTIIAEQAVKISLSDLTPKAISKFADQLRDFQVRAKKSHSRDQLRMMFSEQDRLEVTQTLKSYRFPDGAAIDDAANWRSWSDNEKLAECLKLVYPTSEAISDVQRILQLAKKCKIFHVKNPRHFKTLVAQLQLALQMEDRVEELMSLSAAAYQLLQDAILDQVMGKAISRAMCGHERSYRLY
jgi:vacuolar-type H+-ATPase subunit H